VCVLVYHEGGGGNEFDDSESDKQYGDVVLTEEDYGEGGD